MLRNGIGIVLCGCVCAGHLSAVCTLVLSAASDTAVPKARCGGALATHGRSGSLGGPRSAPATRPACAWPWRGPHVSRGLSFPSVACWGLAHQSAGWPGAHHGSSVSLSLLLASSRLSWSARGGAGAQRQAPPCTHTDPAGPGLLTSRLSQQVTSWPSPMTTGGQVLLLGRPRGQE